MNKIYIVEVYEQFTNKLFHERAFSNLKDAESYIWELSNQRGYKFSNKRIKEMKLHQTESPNETEGGKMGIEQIKQIKLATEYNLYETDNAVSDGQLDEMPSRDEMIEIIYKKVLNNTYYGLDAMSDKPQPELKLQTADKVKMVISDSIEALGWYK